MAWHHPVGWPGSRQKDCLECPFAMPDESPDTAKTVFYEIYGEVGQHPPNWLTDFFGGWDGGHPFERTDYCTQSGHRAPWVLTHGTRRSQRSKSRSLDPKSRVSNQLLLETFSKAILWSFFFFFLKASCCKWFLFFFFLWLVLTVPQRLELSFNSTGEGRSRDGLNGRLEARCVKRRSTLATKTRNVQLGLADLAAKTWNGHNLVGTWYCRSPEQAFLILNMLFSDGSFLVVF